MPDPTIAYILGEFPSLTETFILREMNALMRRGVSLRVFSLVKPRTHTAVPEASELEVTYGPSKWNASVLRAAMAGSLAGSHASPRVGAAVQAWRRVLTAHPEMVHLHAHFANEPALIAMELSKATGLPFSFSAHAWDIYCAGSPLSELISAAEFVTTCTEMNLRHLRSLCREEDRSKVMLLRHGIEVDQFPYCERMPAAPFRCVAIGRLVAKKGFDLLIEAVARLIQSGVILQCDIMGDGPERADLEQLVARLDVKDTVRLLGSLPHGDAMERLRQADALVVPSVVTPEGDRDGLPNVILEAAATGVPIITSDLPSIMEFAEDQVSGLVAKSGDVERLIEKLRILVRDDGTLSLAFRRNARKIVEERYDIKKNVLPLIELFNPIRRSKLNV